MNGSLGHQGNNIGGYPLMHPFHHAIKAPRGAYRMSDVECDVLKARFRIDDDRSDIITAGSAFLWQFWAHDVFNSMADGSQNLYSGVIDGDDGFYGNSTIRQFTMKDGLFKLPDDDLPRINMAPGAQLAPDLHRANENPVLKAFHLWFSRFHNKRMNDHGDFERAKHESLAAVTRLCINEGMLVCGMDSEREFMTTKIGNMNKAFEGNFAIARWAHPQMPDTTNNKPLFRSEYAAQVDMMALWDGSEMARDLNLGVAPSMTRMAHVGGEEDIRERTFGQHNKHGIAGWADAVNRYGGNWQGDDAPIWAGMLLEAEDHGEGTLGPIGARMVADVVASSLLAEYRVENPWKAAPVKSTDIIEYGWV